MKNITALTIPFALALSQPLTAASFITGGHVDLPSFGYDTDDGFEPHIHNEGGANGVIIDGVREEVETEYDPDELILFLNPSSTVTLGTTTYYWLPQSATAAANNGVPFVGIGLEELESADWADGIVSLTLLNISGPGAFRLWQTDEFDNVIDFINPATDTFTFDLAAGSHTHYNWGFTELGVYELEFGISGTHVVDGPQSGSATYTFAVPEPSTALLGAIGALALLRRRR